MIEARPALPVPHPQATPDDLIAWAQEMVPRLRERQARCEALGRIPDETNDEFVEKGLYRILQPRRFGGYEFDMPTFMRVMIEVARGCPSSGWVLALTGGHAIMLSAFFSEEAQIDIYGQDGEFRGPSSTSARVPAMPVKGGYLVREGVWNYASGIDISTHFFAGISVHHETPDGPRLEPRLAVIDRKDYEIVDNWHVVGMRGTGSRQVIARDLFIPEFRTIVPPRDAFNARNAPGRRVHSNSMYAAGRLTSVLFGENAAVAVGVAKGALDVYEDDLQVRTTRFPPFTRLAETVQSQRYYGEAVALIEMAEATVLRAGADYMECARRDVEENILFSDERDQRLQLLEHYAGKAAGDAVEMIFRTSGTHSAQEGSLLQRYFRDMSVMKTHAGAQWDRAAEAYGRVHLTGSSPAAERFAAESGPR